MSDEQQEQVEVVSTPKKNTKVLWLGAGVALVVGLLGLGVVATYGVYNASENKAVLALASAFNVPVAKVNNQPILYSDYIADLRSIRAFYSNQEQGNAYNAEEQSDQVLSRLIANTLVKAAADEMKISLTEEEKTAARADVLARFENDEGKLAADIKKNLGLELNDFYTRILEPTLLEKKLAEHFANTGTEGNEEYKEEQVRASHILFPVSSPADDAKVKAQANKVLAEIKAGAKFADKAKEFGTDSTKDAGGDLGWFGRGAMVAEFEAAAFGLEKGALAPTPIKTEFGYHLIKVEDKRTAANFSLFMNDRLRDAKIEVIGKIHNPFANLNATVSADVETTAVEK